MDTPTNTMPVLPAPGTRRTIAWQKDQSYAGRRRGSVGAGGKASQAGPRRRQVNVACDNCRSAKAKCGGQRPACWRCLGKGAECVYQAQEGETVSLAQKRKHLALERELVQYKELLDLIRGKSERGAREIFYRIRESYEPLDVLKAVQRTESLLPNPSCNGRALETKLTRLDQSALQSSAIKVSAKPWTAVAGDGIVSELITDFFTWDDAYVFPAIDRKSFVDDMKAGAVEQARSCSPLLVNAICAQRSQIVERAKFFGVMTRQNIVDGFLSESKMLLDREQGRPSIPTVQALVLLYLTSALIGRDRAANMYRFTAYEMLKRLGLDKRFESLRNREIQDTREMVRISKALWGVFLLESRIAYFYYQPSIVPPPRIPRLFDSDEQGSGNRDVLGRPLHASSSQVPLVPGILNASCDLSELFYEIMQYLTAKEDIRGSPNDLRTRKAFYSRLRNLRQHLPKNFLLEENFTPATCFLRMHESEIASSLFQALPSDMPFDTDCGSNESVTIKDMCIQHCRSDTDLAEAYARKWPFDTLVTRQLYVTMQSLVPLLDDHAARNLFTRNCLMARLSCHNIKLAGFLLQATQAFAWAMKKSLPDEVRPYLEGWTQDAVDKDLPVSFAIPRQDEIKALMASEDEDHDDQTGGRLGALIEKWAVL